MAVPQVVLVEFMLLPNLCSSQSHTVITVWGEHLIISFIGILRIKRSKEAYVVQYSDWTLEEETFLAKEEANGIALLLTGTSKTGVQYKGHVEIPNLSDENSVDEVEVCAPNSLSKFSLSSYSQMRKMASYSRLVVQVWSKHSEPQSVDKFLAIWCHWKLPEELVLISLLQLVKWTLILAPLPCQRGLEKDHYGDCTNTPLYTFSFEMSAVC